MIGFVMFVKVVVVALTVLAAARSPVHGNCTADSADHNVFLQAVKQSTLLGSPKKAERVKIGQTRPWHVVRRKLRQKYWRHYSYYASEAATTTTATTTTTTTTATSATTTTTSSTTTTTSTITTTTTTTTTGPSTLSDVTTILNLEVNESDADEVLESLRNGTGQAAFNDWLEGYLGDDVVSYTVTFPSSPTSLLSKKASRTESQLVRSERTEFFDIALLAIHIDAVVTSTGYDNFVWKFKGTDNGEQALDIFVNILTAYFPATATLLIGARANLEVWKLLFRQTVPYQWQRDMWSLNADDASADNFAILDQLESFRVNGKFTFRLRWPTMANNQDQIWKQTSNPVTTTNRAATGKGVGFQCLEMSIRYLKVVKYCTFYSETWATRKATKRCQCHTLGKAGLA